MSVNLLHFFADIFHELLISKGIGLRVWFVSEIDILSGELYTVGLHISIFSDFLVFRSENKKHSDNVFFQVPLCLTKMGKFC